MYIETIEYIFQRIPVRLHKPLSLKEGHKHRYMILEVNGTWTTVLINRIFPYQKILIILHLFNNGNMIFMLLLKKKLNKEMKLP